MLVFLCLCSPPSVTTEDNYHQTIYSLTRWERYFRRRRRRHERNILFSRHCLIEVGVHHCSTWLYSSAKNRAINTLTSLSLSRPHPSSMHLYLALLCIRANPALSPNNKNRFASIGCALADAEILNVRPIIFIPLRIKSTTTIPKMTRHSLIYITDHGRGWIK